MPLLDRICLRLAHNGWCNGNPELIAKMSVKWVLKMINYQDFINDHKIESFNLKQELIDF